MIAPQGDMAVLEGDVAPDFVADDQQVMALADVGEGSDLVGVEHATQRIVGVAPQHHLGAGIDGSFETFRVESPVGAGEWHIDQPSAGVIDDRTKRVVDRGEDHDPIAGFGHEFHDQVQAVQGRGEDHRLFFGRAPSEVAFLPVAPRTNELLPGMEVVAGVASIDHRLHRGLDHRSDFEVHIGNPRGDDIAIGVVCPLHSRERMQPFKISTKHPQPYIAPAPRQIRSLIYEICTSRSLFASGRQSTPLSTACG